MYKHYLNFLDLPLIGKIEISDEIKEDSVNAVKMLKKNNIKTVILTGDKKESAKKIGDVVGIDELYSELLPDEKVVMYENIAKNNCIMLLTR